MAYFTKQAIVKVIKKLGGEITEVNDRKFKSIINENYTVEAIKLTSDDDSLWLVALVDRKNPDDMSTDYFTTEYPSKLKDLEWMVK